MPAVIENDRWYSLYIGAQPPHRPPADQRAQLQEDTGWKMRLRRGVVGVSLVGIACMVATMLLQTGVISDLPDPPLPGFKTKKVNSSDEAYSYGGPDSPIAIAAQAANMILASTIPSAVSDGRFQSILLKKSDWGTTKEFCSKNAAKPLCASKRLIESVSENISLRHPKHDFFQHNRSVADNPAWSFTRAPSRSL